ncbi:MULTISPECIES: TetR/AcrR family transcriptional regulator [unclassified Fusibacter]|uniref:TetR/AcrR family transcriptional regulator n=1 Tax=unclassified Fusibacter TaxID=2624464 RepID=UPI001011C60C|nr:MULTISPECIES: TetR/AcrR family transcriptional regulator [unclassified Fusibacter]MCK8058207.1 TetR/AcrR family transcriptional regulator [Fusibacter sp. A2]NPE20790.1 TetR/AcrR family transcriptional regulator [Fusibacter sp. A1]RXV62996.1 TetR/AcrR family transcriptional regulator [Fusibacter sp. A1]
MYSELLMSRLLACECCELKEKARTTKHAILVAALELFMVSGFMKTPVREICEKAGVAKGTFYLYFETKEHVLSTLFSLLNLEFDGLIALLDVTDPSLDQLDLIIDKSVILMEKEQKLLKFMHSPEVLVFVGEDAPNELFSSMEDAVQLWLDAAISVGVVSSNITMLSMELVFNIIHDSLEKAMIYHYPSTIPVVATELKKLIRSMLT